MHSASPYVIVCVALMVVPLVTSSPRHKMAANIKQAETGFIHDVIPVTSQPLDKRVIHGNDAKPGSHPSIVSLQFNDKRYCDKIIWRRDGNLDCSKKNSDSFYHICGGTLIHERWVLTAAHCVNDIYHRTFFDSLRIVVGEHNLESKSGTEQVMEVENVVIHPHYVDEDTAEDFDKLMRNDIALIQLKNPVILSNDVQIATLPKHDAYVNSECVIAGWGSVDPTDNIQGTILQEAKTTVISNDECLLYADIFERSVNRRQVCILDKKTNSKHNSGPCRGDSGGPLFCGPNHDVLVGVTSLGFAHTCYVVLPEVYTRVSSYLKFIMRETEIDVHKG